MIKITKYKENMLQLISHSYKINVITISYS